jgi:hypothetical protein
MRTLGHSILLPHTRVYTFARSLSLTAATTPFVAAPLPRYQRVAPFTFHRRHTANLSCRHSPSPSSCCIDAATASTSRRVPATASSLHHCAASLRPLSALSTTWPPAQHTPLAQPCHPHVSHAPTSTDAFHDQALPPSPMKINMIWSMIMVSKMEDVDCSHLFFMANGS